MLRPGVPADRERRDGVFYRIVDETVRVALIGRKSGNFPTIDRKSSQSRFSTAARARRQWCHVTLFTTRPIWYSLRNSHAAQCSCTFDSPSVGFRHRAIHDGSAPVTILKDRRFRWEISRVPRLS